MNGGVRKKVAKEVTLENQLTSIDMEVLSTVVNPSVRKTTTGIQEFNMKIPPRFVAGSLDKLTERELIALDEETNYVATSLGVDVEEIAFILKQAASKIAFQPELLMKASVRRRIKEFSELLFKEEKKGLVRS